MLTGLTAIGRLFGQRRFWFSLPRTELEHWGDRRSQADQVDGPPQERIARYHGMLVAYPSGI
jgi:hypothetical protein